MRTFKVVSSMFLSKYTINTPFKNQTVYNYSLTIDQTLDDINREEAMAIGANIYERWFMSKGIKKWLFGLLVKRYK